MSVEQASTTPSTTTAAAFPVTAAAPLIDAAALAHVIATTEEIFGAKPSVETMVDPEDPQSCWLTITVRAAGDTGELVRRRLEWHARMNHLNLSNHPRLSIIPIA